MHKRFSRLAIHSSIKSAAGTRSTSTESAGLSVSSRARHIESWVTSGQGLRPPHEIAPGVNDRPNPVADLFKFLTSPGWPTPVFWALLLASCAFAAVVWWRDPSQRSGRRIALWLLRLVTGGMWWQQSLWKI